MTLPHSTRLTPIGRTQAVGMAAEGLILSLVRRFGGIVTSLVLVRLIDKELYGAASVALAILSVIMSFSIGQFAESSFHEKNADTAAASFRNHLGFGVALHAVLSVVLMVISLILAHFDVYALTSQLLLICALVPLLNVLRMIYSTDLRRRLEWRRIRLIGLVSFGISCVTAIGLAAADYGALALITAQLITPIPYIVDLLRRRPDLLMISFRLKGYGGSLRYGLFRGGGEALYRGRELFENMVISAVLGLTALGVYGRAGGLAQLTTGWLGSQLSQSLYPVLARYRSGTEQYRRASSLLARVAFWFAVPPGVLVSVSSEATVSLLFGERWLDTLVYLQPVLLITAANAILGALHVIAYGVLGPRAPFISQLLTLVIVLVCGILIFTHSLVIFLWACAMLYIALSLGFAGIVLRSAGLTTRDLCRIAAPPAVLVALAALAEWSGWLELLRGLPDFPELVATGAATGLVTILALRILDREGLIEFVSFVPARYGELIRRSLVLPAQRHSAVSMKTTQQVSDAAGSGQ